MFPRTWNGLTLFGQNLDRLLLIEGDRALELRRSYAGVDLRGVYARMSQERTNLLEVVMLFEHFHRDSMTKVMWLEFGDADHSAVDLAEPPDVLARHRGTCLANRATTPGRPEERS